MFHQFHYYNYGSSEHHSEARPIYGSVVLSAYESDSTRLEIHYLVLSGSSQGVVGRNLTSRPDIMKVGENFLRLVAPTAIPCVYP